MKILFLSDNFWPETNAPATRLIEHARHWVRHGHQVTVITSAPNFPAGKLFAGYENRWHAVENVEGIRVVRVKTFITANEGFVKRTLDYLSFMVSSVAAGLFEERPDLVVATSPQFFTAVGGWFLAAIRRLPFVFELRDLWPATILAVGALKRGLLVRALEGLELFLYRRATAIVAVTESFKRELIHRGIEGSKIYVVRNGVDLSTFAPRPDKDPALLEELGLTGKFVVGYLGTHGLCHGLEKVVDAAALLRGAPNVAFLFAGAGAERETVRRLAEEQGLSNVVMLPSQPKERMPALWSVCDATVIPLRDDPLFATVIPSKLFEAVGMGIPVILSLPEGESSDIVRNSGIGVVVPPENPADLAREIVALRSDPARLAAYRAACSKQAPGFSRELLAEEMLRVFREAVGKTGTASS
jgi:glycosyltransferase involved in cell wall biosynthesis